MVLLSSGQPTKMILLNGEYRGFHKNGLTRVIENYYEGNLSGKQELFLEDGMLWREAFYKNGKLEGNLKEFYDEKMIKKEEFYEGGVLKTAREYDSSGNLIYTFGY
jgi:antitoxin component YwqK of YwqJK toxin-antitoxin module